MLWRPLYFQRGMLSWCADRPNLDKADCHKQLYADGAMIFNVEKAELVRFNEALKKCGEVVSVFMKFAPAVFPAREFASAFPLNDLMRHPEFCKDAIALGKISSGPMHYSTLNRLEFEGSLAQVLIEGGCFRNTTPEAEARKLAADVLAAVFPKPFDDLLVFRLDDPGWSQFTDAATVSHTYFAWQGARGLWWMLSVADTD